MHRRTFLTLTPRGLVMLALSLCALGSGVLRSDMAGLFWGASFLLTVLYAAAGNLFTRMLAARSRKKPGFLEVHLPAAVISPGEKAEAHVAAEVPRFIIPGFGVFFHLPLAWQERRIGDVRAGLKPGANSLPVPFTPEKRGSYTAAAALMEVRDVLGFTRSAVSVPLEDSVKVFPRVPREMHAARIPEEGGDSIRFSPHRRRSQELLEVRKYFPGDDMRKLNWKVFAHSSELFLRMGEETPPPESRFLFILDATRNPAVPARRAADFLDGMVEACASAMSQALSRGAEALFLASGAVRGKSYTQESRQDLMAALAGLWWSEPGWRPELPPDRRLHAVVVSSAGSPELEHILAAVKARGWKASLLLRDLPPAGERRGPRSVRDLLFVPKEPQ